MKTGIELIAAERQEQIEKHGITTLSDSVINDNYELRRGAIALLENDKSVFSKFWNPTKCNKMIEKDYRERLIIAGALIAAEIDRINLIKSPN